MVGGLFYLTLQDIQSRHRRARWPPRCVAWQVVVAGLGDVARAECRFILAPMPSSSAQRANKAAATRRAPTSDEVEALRQKRAWDVAFAPAKSVPMNAFMLYMSGSGVQIFSMMVVGMLLTNPIKAIMTTNACESRAERPRARPTSRAITDAWCKLRLTALPRSLSRHAQHSLRTQHRASRERYCCSKPRSSLASWHVWDSASTSAGAWACFLQQAATGLPGASHEQ